MFLKIPQNDIGDYVGSLLDGTGLVVEKLDLGLVA